MLSISPRRRAIVRPLLVRVWNLNSPLACVSIPSNTTSLSFLHHQAGLPPASVRARTDVPVKASMRAPGPGSKHPPTSGLGGVKMRIFSSTFLGDIFRRSLRRSVGERKAAFDCVLELRIRSYLFSSSVFCFETSVAVFAPRFNSAGRHKRRAVESVRWREGGSFVEGACFNDREGVLDRDRASSLDAIEGGFDLEKTSSLSER